MLPSALLLAIGVHADQQVGAKQETVAAYSKGCLMENGLAYGPFRDGQSPDTDLYPSVAQIQEDLTFLSHVTKRIRIYGTKGTFARIPAIAKDLGISVMQGIYLGKNKEENKKAIDAAVQLARSNLIDSIIVGNEELTGSLISKQELLDYIQLVKKICACQCSHKHC